MYITITTGDLFEKIIKLIWPLFSAILVLKFTSSQTHDSNILCDLYWAVKYIYIYICTLTLKAVNLQKEQLLSPPAPTAHSCMQWLPAVRWATEVKKKQCGADNKYELVSRVEMTRTSVKEKSFTKEILCVMCNEGLEESNVLGLCFFLMFFH